MQYRQLDKNMPPVSILGFGCMRFYRIDGSLNFMDSTTPVDEKLVNRLIHYALEQGVNYYDTAYTYLGGMSESILGKQFRPSQRQNVFLATKLPAWKVEKTADMESFLNEQLQRLQTDYIDYYLVHSLTQKTWNQVVQLGIFEFLDRIKQSGKVRSIGFSFHDQYPVYKTILNAYPWDFCQILFNYHDTDYQAGFQGYLDAIEKGIRVVSMEPLLGGKLATQLPQEALESLHQVHPDWTPAEWALRWVWNHEGASTLLSGMNQMDQVEENCRIASNVLPSSLQKKEMEAIQYVKEILEKRTRVRCTSCSYCMP
ncbi:MAG: aldo/keto reductase [Caldisericia bacterium]|nr:aldo/keto reductase [Caldisericia bacterium]